MLNRMERLEQRFKEHPKLLDHPENYRPGFLKAVMKTFATSISELEVAVEIIVTNPIDYYDPIGLLSKQRKSDWPFSKTGKCTLKDYGAERTQQSKKDQLTQAAKEKHHWTGSVPDWDRALHWFRMLPHEQAEAIKQHIRIQLDWICSPFSDLFSERSPGRYYLVQCWRYATDPAYHEFVDGYTRREKA